MFTTVEEVEEITGWDGVDPETIIGAQHIIEAYVGRSEAEVTDARDRMILAKATAFQAVYLGDKENWNRVFLQLKAQQIMQYGNLTSFFNDDSPHIAPLAVIACRHLSWKRMRSVKTGSIFTRPLALERWETT